jgi:hypothetical protein
MSATKVHLYSESDGLSFRTQHDAPIIWIQNLWGSVVVSLDLSAAARAKLRAALDAADKIAGLMERPE